MLWLVLTLALCYFYHLLLLLNKTFVYLLLFCIHCMATDYIWKLSMNYFFHLSHCFLILYAQSSIVAKKKRKKEKVGLPKVSMLRHLHLWFPLVFGFLQKWSKVQSATPVNTKYSLNWPMFNVDHLKLKESHSCWLPVVFHWLVQHHVKIL